MIVCAIDHNYLEYTKLFLSSLIKNSPSSIKRLRYFVFDYTKDKLRYRMNCYNAILQLSRFNRSIDVNMIPFEDMDEIHGRFRMLFDAMGIKHFLKTNMMDYLKGYLFKYLNKTPYLFLDNDIIVRGDIEALYARCKEKGKIAMSKLKHFELPIYFQYYTLHTNLVLSSRYRSLGPLCGGVLFVPRDYTDIWFDIFSKSISRFGINGHPAQGVWNVLFWLEKGYLLPEKYNFIMDRKQKACKNAVLLHFPERLKEIMPSFAF